MLKTIKNWAKETEDDSKQWKRSPALGLEELICLNDHGIQSIYRYSAIPQIPIFLTVLEKNNSKINMESQEI